MQLLLNAKYSLLAYSIGDVFLIINLDTSKFAIGNHKKGEVAAPSGSNGDNSLKQAKKIVSSSQPSNKIVNICFSDYNDDGEDAVYFSSAHENKNIIVWKYNKKMNTLVRSGSFKCGKRPSSSLFSTFLDTKVIIIGQANGDVVARPIAPNRIQKEQKILTTHTTSMVTCINICNKGEYLISGDRDEQIRVSNFPKSFLIESFCLGHYAFITSINTVGFDDNVLLSTAGDGSVRLFEISTGKELYAYDFSEEVELPELVTVGQASGDGAKESVEKDGGNASIEHEKKRKGNDGEEIFDEDLRERRLIVNEVCSVGSVHDGKIKKNYFLVRFDEVSKLAIISINGHDNDSGGVEYTISRIGWLEMERVESIVNMQYDPKKSCVYILVVAADDNYSIEVRHYEFRAADLFKVSDLGSKTGSSITNETITKASNKSDSVIPLTLKESELKVGCCKPNVLKEINTNMEKMWARIKELNSDADDSKLLSAKNKYYGMRKRKHKLQIDLLALP